MLAPDLLADVAIVEGTESWGTAKDLKGQESVFSNDLIIPKLRLLQGSSDWVKSREYEHQAGDYVNSLTEEILGNPEKPIRFVVISMSKRWQFFWQQIENGKVKDVYDREYSTLVTPQNVGLPYSGQIDGKEYRRRQVLCFTILLERDIIAGNKQPYNIDFAASSKKGGRILYSDLSAFTSKVHTVGGKNYTLPSAAAAYELTTSEEMFDDNSVWVKNIKPIGHSSKEAVLMARELYKFIDGNDAVTEHEVVDDDAMPAEEPRQVESSVVDNAEKGQDFL